MKKSELFAAGGGHGPCHAGAPGRVWRGGWAKDDAVLAYNAPAPTRKDVTVMHGDARGCGKVLSYIERTVTLVAPVPVPAGGLTSTAMGSLAAEISVAASCWGLVGYCSRRL